MPRFWVGGFADNLKNMLRDCNNAASAGCDIVIFPEQFLTGYHGEYDLGQIKDTFAEISAKHQQVLFIFGTISEQGFNRQYSYRAGYPLGYYDKIHLFKPNGEDQMWKVGNRYVAVEHQGIRIGLATCNDVRFPDQSSRLKAELGVQMLIYPALWPWQRDHVWNSLLRTRAAENGVFCAGCCVAGVDNGKERFDGAGNYLFDPLGNPVYTADRIYEVDLEILKQVKVDTHQEFVEIAKVELIGGAH